ncbi:MAG: SDR family NAD(P)-dependent oxidoreductase [Dehalococcoidia bacterium]
MQYYHDRIVWITGASTGIGAACARVMARRGARVALSARSEAKLDELVREIGADRALAVPLDVTDRESNAGAVRRIVGHFGRIDTAFLNAGTWLPMDLPAFDSAIFEETMRINVMGMVYGIEAVLPELMKSQGAHLVGMSSSAAYRGIPRGEAYCASKAAIRAMLQGLRCQLKPRGVSVTVVMPGFVKSPLTDTNDFKMPFLMETDDAARIIADGVARRRTEIAFPWQWIALLRLAQMLPDGIYTSLMAKRAVRK